MAKCHFKQDDQHVPVAVLTGLDLADGIIVNNSYPVDNTLGSWAVVGARVSITRFWSASSATVMLAPNMPNISDRPQLVPIKLGLEDEFSIWMGYIDACRPVTVDDLKEGRLLRVFTGVIENLKDTQTVQGVSLTIQARDRMKWLLDSSIWFSAREILEFQNLSRAHLILDIANKAIGATLIGDGYTSILGAEETPVGQPTTPPTSETTPSTGETSPPTSETTPSTTETKTESVKGKVINKPTDPYYFVSPESENSNSILQANLWYQGETSTSDTTTPPTTTEQDSDATEQETPTTTSDKAPLGSKLKSLEKLEPNPEFRILSTRVALETTTDETKNAVNYLLAGNQPMEVLKALSFQEIYPMEIFQSHYDGNLYYVPRGNDLRGLDDKERFNRRYFFKSIDDSLDSNQRLIALRTEMSSIGIKTNFVVSKQAPNAQEEYDDYILHLMTQPAVLRGKSYALKFHKLYDPTIKTAVDAALISIALAQIWSKEVNAGLTVMLGDPSIVPGEIIQVFGDINSNNDFINYTEANKDKTLKDYLELQVKAFKEYDSHWNKTIQELVELSKSEDNSTTTSLPVAGNPNAKLDINTPPTSTEGDTTNTTLKSVLDNPSKVLSEGELGFDKLPKTIYRVEAIIHKFNLGSLGYTTELALTSPL